MGGVLALWDEGHWKVICFRYYLMVGLYLYCRILGGTVKSKQK